MYQQALDSPSFATAVRYHWHRLRREATNYSLYKSRHAQAQIASQHQSGTHWLKYTLASALSHHYGLPAPQYNHANDFIGGPKDEIIYPQLPRLVSSHSIPPLISPLLVRVNAIKLPKYLVLVRDIRASLVSNFRKWTDRYGVSFSEFLRGDLSGQNYNSDIWWSIRFLNAWGKLRLSLPAAIQVVHYEKLLADTHTEIDKINLFIGLSLTETDIEFGVAAGSKSEMLSKADPNRPPGEIHTANTPLFDWFNEADKQFVSRCCDRFLQFDFGYNYERWESLP